MSLFRIDYAPAKSICIGYRSPGLSQTHSPKQKMQLARDLGMEVIEPQLNEREFPSLDAAKQMRDASDQYGIRIPSVGGFVPITDPNPVPTLEQQVKKACEYATVLGAGYVFSRVMPQPEGISQADAWKLIRRNGSKAGQMFADNGIKWAIEADPPCFIHTLERVRRVLETIDHPNCFFNFDPANLYVAGSDPVKAIHELSHRMKSGHIKDGYFAGVKQCGELPVGSGEVPYPEIFQALMENGVCINMFIEHCKTEEVVRAAAAWIAGFVKEKIPAMAVS